MGGFQVSNLGGNAPVHPDAELIEEAPVFSFRLEQPKEMEDLLYEKIKGHYDGLDLLTRFAENSADVVDELAFIIKSSVEIAIPTDNSKESISRTALKLQEKFGKNYWKALLYIECISNEEIYNFIISHTL